MFEATITYPHGTSMYRGFEDYIEMTQWLARETAGLEAHIMAWCDNKPIDQGIIKTDMETCLYAVTPRISGSQGCDSIY